jgi:hypothetical protein
MRQEIMLGCPMTIDTGHAKEGIYVSTDDDLGKDIKSCCRIVDNKSAWLMTVVGHRFSFVLKEASKFHTSNNVLDRTNNNRVACFNALISEHYPQDLDSVIAVQSKFLQ